MNVFVLTRDRAVGYGTVVSVHQTLNGALARAEALLASDDIVTWYTATEAYPETWITYEGKEDETALLMIEEWFVED